MAAPGQEDYIMLNMEQLEAMAAEAGFTHTAPLDARTLELKQEVRDGSSR